MDRNMKTAQRYTDLRTMMGLALTFASLMALLSLVACAPKPVERKYPEPKTDFGPLQKDPDLGLDQNVQKASITTSQLTWKGTVDTGRVFRFAETMSKLGALENQPSFVKFGQRVGAEFYKSRANSTYHPFNESLYINAAIGETKEDILPIVDENDKMLASQIPLIQGVLDEVSSRTKWPTVTTPPRDALVVAGRFGEAFLNRAKDSKINRDIYNALAETLKNDFFPLVNGLTDEVDSILAEPRSVTMLHRIKDIAKRYDVDLGPDAGKMLNQAEEVMVQIENIERNHDALTVIVELWEMTDVENRQKTFEPVSKDLYNYLKNKSPGELGCVKNPRCLNPFIMIPKKIGLLPAIEKYGLPKLKNDISKAAHDSLVKQIAEQVALFVPTVPKEIGTKVSDEIGKIRKKLADVKADFPTFVKGLAHEYMVQNLDTDGDQVRLKGLEASRVKVSVEPGNVEFEPVDTGDMLSTGGEVIGSSMAYAASVWDTEALGPVAYQKSVLSQINKMLSIGGFQTPSGKRYPSLALSLDRKAPLKHFNAKDSLGAGVAFAIPDAFKVESSFNASFSAGAKDVSVRSQAELLRGLSAMIRYFRDWEPNAFDKTMGAVQIGKLIKGIPAGAVQQKLFPKDSFFSLAVANAASILQNMTLPLSPVFLIDIENKTSWANERSDDEDKPATMAGIVDIVGGQRGDTVHTSDAARFLLAIAEFLDATNGIENSQATALLKEGADGKKPVDMIKDARQQLTLLIVGLGNFISHEMAGKDGGVRATFHRSKVSADTAEPRTAIDQAICILALLKAGDVIGKKIYEWPALDAYAFMNRVLFNAATGFYASSEATKELPAADEIATILLAGEALKARMSGKSRDQWNLIAAPWMKALEGL